MLQPIGHQAIAHQCSLYAGDAILFIALTAQDLAATTASLDLFRASSGLHTNLQKYVVAPICCSEEQINTVMQFLPCQIFDFPITYLGMPLSTGRLAKVHLEPVVDKVRSRLPTWKAGLLHKAGRLPLMKYTMSAVPIYTLISINRPAWALKAIDKYHRGFFWTEAESASGVQCTLAWSIATRPYELGELGVPDLKLMGYVLRFAGYG